ncbi:hypothetical protein SMACR_03343 [Sordaria macrospora]|uniref:WGS project CABT00000000 data, contig 2.10 n=2 Tax=Sordaria macrospora TaxID=5147 RepID=F7VWL9_SORMK|nr:uncharacterized protein SMAC_03343 [Sordaria macrospora k-hell]KAA8629036.1 hypothetical protein SMACR_03343 [Sordaria macrospora]KAH7630016.1 hypothetical protein B0T09DRAFT_399728 [Sordaria sp. MPI-SDFR-AT-0083]WPJ66698.1 hypothetical protein SMAC4_03343 [Sordaria macrospora]CCC09787.1 unnamed protein product [Sordaria macrospora k-hell]
MAHHYHHPQQCSILMNVLFTLLFASLSSSLTPNDNQNHATLLPLPNHIITQFPNPTWLENIAVRSNGDLLTESAPTASLHLVSNLDLNHHSYSSKSNGSGSTTKRKTTHTTASNSNSDAHETTPKIKSITQLTQALLPNGVTSLPPPGNPNTVLIADSFAGLVWCLDIPYG